MAKTPAASELDVSVSYLREQKRPANVGVDDWSISTKRFRTIHKSFVRIRARSGADVLVGAGLESRQEFEVWDRWKDGIKTTDVIEETSGQRYQIRSRINVDHANEWSMMVVVHTDG